ncbi:phage holin [Buttiauxella gaviniae ATCC 51604]|uniref:Phage holin n=1 Tax=Buttiauxella gaviniae ATCC 51604 TaxID=1354253 RepID=A0A1B7I4J3_9ENTR|nr:holin [Buttiauxella gaviniae]EIY1687689.1 holin [Escherichia coli]OAT23280.1 phage holin [Buttiauxella gaviniae ATCC 51604]
MQEHEKTLYTLLAIGCLGALGKMLDGNDPITPRLFFSRVIIGSLTSTAAGAVLLQVPGASPLTIIGLGAALGIGGHQALEIWLRRKNKDSE